MFSFQTLVLFAIFSIFVVRERGYFWQSMPGKALLTASLADLALAISIALIGIPGLKPLPPNLTLLILGYSLLFSLIINDIVKCSLLKSLF